MCKLGIIIAICVLFMADQAKAWDGTVVGVSDGDTITVMHDGKGVKVRVYGIDAPEKGQDFGRKAKQFTSDTVYGKTVSVVPLDKDRYGRTVARIEIDGQDLSEALITAGLAWVYREYCTWKICEEWLELEEKARTEGRGLWAQQHPTSPWRHRKR